MGTSEIALLQRTVLGSRPVIRRAGPRYADETVRVFCREAFAYHKVSVVFWQSDERDRPAVVTEPYGRAFTAGNLKKEQDFYASDLRFCVRIKKGDTEETRVLLLRL